MKLSLPARSLRITNTAARADSIAGLRLYGSSSIAGQYIVGGALSGATIGVAAGSWVGGLIAGVIGAVIGTFGGAEIRARMAKAFGRDQPAAFIEDAGAIILGLIVVWALR